MLHSPTSLKKISSKRVDLQNVGNEQYLIFVSTRIPKNQIKDIITIQKLLYFGGNCYPILLLTLGVSLGLTIRFYLKKGFGNQVYSKFKIEMVTSTTELTMREDILSGEDEEILIERVSVFISELSDDINVDIVE